MGLFRFFKRKNVAQNVNNTPAPINKANSIVNTTPSNRKICKPEGMPSRKPIKQLTISPVGITYDCRKTDKYTRQDILINMHEGDKVVIEKYKYKGKDAYMLVDVIRDDDFGVINSSLANDISTNYSDCTFEAYISKIDSFYPDEKSDDLINTCRVKLYILPKLI